MCGCENEPLLPTEAHKLSIHYQRTGGLMGGVSDELIVIADTTSMEELPDGAYRIDPETAKAIVAILEAERFFTWSSMSHPPHIQDLFKHILRVELDGVQHDVEVYDLPDGSPQADRLIHLVHRLREELGAAQ